MACDDITLVGLSRLNACENNMGGVKTIYICPAKDVVKINAKRKATPTDQTDFVTIGSSTMDGKAIECVEGKGFVKIYCAEDMGELKYASQGTIVGGRSLKATLDIFNPGFGRAGLGFISYFNNADAIIVVKLNNGTYHLLGDTDRGALLAEGNEHTSGKATTDNIGINPVFEYNEPYAQLFWEDFDPEDETHGIPIISASTSQPAQSGS